MPKPRERESGRKRASHSWWDPKIRYIAGPRSSKAVGETAVSRASHWQGSDGGGFRRDHRLLPFGTAESLVLKLGIRSKLFLVSLGLIVFSVAIANAYLTRALDTDMTERIRQELLVRLHLIERTPPGGDAIPGATANPDAAMIPTCLPTSKPAMMPRGTG